MNDRSEKINVLLTSKPIAMMSLMLSLANFLAFSIVKSFHKYFSSSVSCMTRGTSKACWSHLVNIKGIKCPKWRAEDDGPLPVYRKNGFFSSYRFRMRWRSRWEKNIPLRRKWWAFWPITASIRERIVSSILLQPKRTVGWIKCLIKFSINSNLSHNY